MTISNLGACLRSQGQLAAAEPLLQAAVDGSLASLGEQHPSTLNSIKQLAILHRKQGCHSVAEAGLRRALAGQRSLLGRQHASTLGTQGWLEVVLCDQAPAAHDHETLP